MHITELDCTLTTLAPGEAVTLDDVFISSVGLRGRRASYGSEPTTSPVRRHGNDAEHVDLGILAVPLRFPEQ
jgi:hypothetical protein